MRKQKELTYAQRNMFYTKELWKLILEAEELVRNQYKRLAERELYDLYEEDREDSEPF